MDETQAFIGTLTHYSDFSFMYTCAFRLPQLYAREYMNTHKQNNGMLRRNIFKE